MQGKQYTYDVEYVRTSMTWGGRQTRYVWPTKTLT
ncbi:hypothetical protein BBR47_44560 [Brevibacillus brevis NBRC 100599]|uniref:Uncharacterized protein n=1 Tax=Brevibacillus brevis (strain 47 / JCM 6285 / NBRC 100599) TaxID=358681 RepID=C0ZJ58_BREBN|nr:hypothetical protein BBR47_44560 [Brevibacillus brevis NBRC 100599]